MGSERTPNRQFNLTEPGSLAVRIGTYQRRRMYAKFMSKTKVGLNEKILDVGVADDLTYESSNYLEQWYPHRSSITAVGIDNAAYLKNLYGVQFVRASGLHLPFCDAAFDVVHSSAVLEHVGALENQIAFIHECCRVARRCVFLTTPNKWFPIEFHTLLPFVHWLPKEAFRALIRSTRYNFFAEEINLNLLSPRGVRAITNRISEFAFEVSSVSLFG